MNSKTWIYGPQVSMNNTLYAVGGSMWLSNYTTCDEEIKPMYEILNTRTIYTAVVINNGARYGIDIILDHLRSCKNICDVLLIHSAFINTYGLIHSGFINSYGVDPSIYKLHSIYIEIYNITRHLLVDKRHMDMFVSPENFLKLNNKTTYRPRNAVLEYSNLGALNEAVKVTPLLQIDKNICPISIKKEFIDLYEKVKNETFKEFAHTLACNSSLLKTSVTLTERDMYMFKSTYLRNDNIKQAPPILIYKKERTYLSQLFEKTCALFYKPVELKDTKENLKILKENCSAYAYGNLSVFNTPIMSATSIRTNMPVFFIENDKVIIDYSPKKTFEFLKMVLQELLDLKVFIPIENNDRYVIDLKFDIEKLECYNSFPSKAKTPELKASVTQYFYLFIGNLFHLIITNHIHLPFKLSLSHILTLFNIIDMTKNIPLLISIYLTEKAKPEFVKEIVKIMEDPTHLLRSTFFKRTGTEGVRMNSYIFHIAEHFNVPLYNRDNNVLYTNVIKFIYTNSIVEYYNDNYFNFQKGVKEIKDYGVSESYQLSAFTPFLKTSPTQQVIEKLLKCDKYLSG